MQRRTRGGRAGMVVGAKKLREKKACARTRLRCSRGKCSMKRSMFETKLALCRALQKLRRLLLNSQAELLSSGPPRPLSWRVDSMFLWSVGVGARLGGSLSPRSLDLFDGCSQASAVDSALCSARHCVVTALVGSAFGCLWLLGGALLSSSRR